jgi:hypothetical protein
MPEESEAIKEVRRLFQLATDNAQALGVRVWAKRYSMDFDHEDVVELTEKGRVQLECKEVK